MKKLFVVIAVLLLGTGPSLAQKTKAQIDAEILTLFPDNTSGQITPLGLRTVTTDITNSIMPTAPVGSGNVPCYSGTTGLLNDCGTPIIGSATGTSLTLGGTDLAPSATNKVSVSTASGIASLIVGQDSTHGVGFLWTYNATPANATAAINTSGYFNPLTIDASTLTLQGVSGGATTIFNSGVAPTGTGAYVRANAPTLVNPIFAGALSASSLTLTSASANVLAVGPNGATNPAFNIDASTASAATGLNVKAAAAAGGVALTALSSTTNESISFNAKGSGAISIGNGSTGTTALGVGGGGVNIASALTYGGVQLNNAVSGTGNMVLSTSPALTTPAIGAATGTSLALGGATLGANALAVTGSATISSTLTSTAHTITSASATALAVGLSGSTNPAFQVDASAATQATGVKIFGLAQGSGTAIIATSSGTNEAISLNAKGSGAILIGNVTTGAVTITPATTLSNALTYGGVTLSNSVTGTGSMVLAGNNPAITLGNGTGLPLSTGVTGTLQAAQEPAHTGDCTNTAGSLAMTCLKTNGVSFTAGATAAAGQLPGTATNDNATAGNVGEVITGAGEFTPSAFTITIAAPAVVTFPTTTWTRGCSGNGTAPFVPTTTGALPTGLTSGTTVWIICSTVSGSTAQIATTLDNAVAGTAITTTGSQSGSHTATSPAVTSNSTIDLAGVRLTSGDWEVNETVYANPAAGTSMTDVSAYISSVANTPDVTPGKFSQIVSGAFVPGAGVIITASVPPYRISLSSSTTIRCDAIAVFTVSTVTGSCYLKAIRAR